MTIFKKVNSGKNNFSKETDELAVLIVASALDYKTEYKELNSKQNIDIGAEIIYFFLYLVDRYAFQLAGEKRDLVFDTVLNKTFSYYSRAVFNKDTPIEIMMLLNKEMLDKINLRQSTYAQCKEILSKDFPNGNTAIYKLSVFINAVIKNIKITCEDTMQMPNPQDILILNIYIGTCMSSLGIGKRIERINHA